MPFYIGVDIWWGVTDPLLTHSQTLKDRATQLLIKYKSGALVTQSGLLEESNCFERLDRLQRVAAAFKEQLNNAMDAVIRKQPNN